MSTIKSNAAPAPFLSVVIPCYNEQEVITELLKRVTSVCRALESTYEIILVNDGSSDATWPMIEAAARDDRHVVGVDLSRNHGHQLALTAGLTVSRGDRILILDADLQDPPELLPDMLRVMEEQRADVVYAQRLQREGETAFKKTTASLFYRLIERLTDVPIPRDTGDFRLMTRRALDVLLAMPERHRFIRGMVSWIGFRQIAFPYERQARFAGTTKYPLKRMIKFALDAITSFSVKPLTIASLAGVVAGMVAVALGMYSVVAYFLGGTVVGWTSVVSLVTFLGSIQLFVLGIVGEYLGRLYEQAKGRPLFIVSSIARSDEEDAPIEGVAIRNGLYLDSSATSRMGASQDASGVR